MIQITFNASFVEEYTYLSLDGGGPVFFKSWLKAYHPETGVVFLDDNWSFNFETNLFGGVYVFTKKDDGDIMILTKRVKSVEEYKRVGATGIEPVSSRM